jgi:hypothetical protein
MIFKFLEDFDGIASPASELIDLLSTEFVLPDGTVLNNDNNQALTVNNSISTFIPSHVTSYSARSPDERVFEYSDFPERVVDDVLGKYIQLSYLRRFSMAKFDIDNNPKETNFIPSNSSFSYTMNFNTLKLNKKQREEKYYDHDFYKEYSVQYLEGMRTLSSPPVFHIYTENEDIVDYRNVGFMINHGLAGFWCNCEVDRIDVETARNNNSIFQSIEARIKIPQGEVDDHSS